MRFDLIRLVLLPREQGDLWESRTPEGRRPTREEWLRRVLADRIDFEHRGVEYHYVPADPDPSGLITAMVGRQRTVKENEPPDRGLEQTARTAWKAVPVVIDPSHHDDGQKVATGHSPDVARTPLALIQALASGLSSRPSEPYVVEANSIIDPNTFFGFVREHRGEVTSVTFELIAPNMFRTRSDLDQEMRELRDIENVQKTTMQLQSESGLNLETERIKQTAEYASEGGGNISAKTRRGLRFTSKNKGVTATVEGVEDPFLEPTSRFRRIIEAIFGK